jgi:hypothetical protein
MPVVDAELPRPSAGGVRFASVTSAWIAGSSPANDEWKERKKKIRRRNADRRNFSILPCRRARPRLQAAGAHLSAFHRGSRPKESFIARDSAPGFCFLGLGLSVEWALPTPAYPSPANASRPSRSVRGLMPNAARERVASPPAGTVLARAIRECLPGRVRDGRGSKPHVTELVTKYK